MARSRLEFGLVAIAIGAVPTLAIATETITYSYNARGRLIVVNHSGTVNNNVVTTYTYDRADNRNQVTTTGAH